MRWPIVGQIPASLAGAAAVALASPDGLAVLFGVLVLVGVGLSVIGHHPRPTRAVGFAAGAASGFMGTTTGIGGPPMALVFQRERGTQIRASLARFFGVGSVTALLPLFVFGQVHPADLALAAVLLPGALVGFWLSHAHGPPGRPSLSPSAVLAISATSAVVVLVRALL